MLGISKHSITCIFLLYFHKLTATLLFQDAWNHNSGVGLDNEAVDYMKRINSREPVGHCPGSVPCQFSILGPISYHAGLRQFEMADHNGLTGDCNEIC